MTIEEQDRAMLQAAYFHASKYSTDPNTQNAAVLIDDMPSGFDDSGRYILSKKIVASGANHFPDGVKELPERWERPIKYSYVEHAERNCIYSAAKRGIKTDGLVMYCPWFACADCARAIIQAGIAEVVGHDIERPPSKT